MNSTGLVVFSSRLCNRGCITASLLCSEWLLQYSSHCSLECILAVEMPFYLGVANCFSLKTDTKNELYPLCVLVGRTAARRGGKCPSLCLSTTTRQILPSLPWIEMVLEPLLPTTRPPYYWHMQSPTNYTAGFVHTRLLTCADDKGRTRGRAPKQP